MDFIKYITTDPVGMFPWQLVLFVPAVLIGGVLGWYFSKHYYKKAGDELREEATELRHMSNVILQLLEHQERHRGGPYRIERDEKGKPLRVLFDLGRAAAVAQTSGSGNLGP